MNSRNVVTHHYDSGLYKQCPICQHVIDLDHDAAIEVNNFMSGFDLVEVVEPLDQDLVAEAFDVDPDKTIPPVR